MVGAEGAMRPLRSFGPNDLAGDPKSVQRQGDAWRIEVPKRGLFSKLFGDGGPVVSLFKTDVRDAASCFVVYRGRLKSEGPITSVNAAVSFTVEGQGGESMGFLRPERDGGPLSFTKPLEVANEWAAFEIAASVPKGMVPTEARLVLSMEGSGSVSVKEVEVFASPRG